MIYDNIIELKTIRDIYLDFLDSILILEVDFADIISSLTEKVYNAVLDASIWDENTISYSEDNFEYYKFYIWETFICSVAFLKHHEKYKDLNNLLCTTYFLRESYFRGSKVNEKNYTAFWCHFSILEDRYKPTTLEPRIHTLAGKMLCEREKRPIYTKNSLAEADLLLYQLYKCLKVVKIGEWREYWFPTCYIYFDDNYTQWIRLKSQKYCEKIMPLFGVSSIEELKNVIKDCTIERDMNYKGGFNCAPAILSSITIDEIGSIG